MRLPHEAHSLLPINVTLTAVVGVGSGAVLHVVADGLSTPFSAKNANFKLFHIIFCSYFKSIIN